MRLAEDLTDRSSNSWHYFRQLCVEAIRRSPVYKEEYPYKYQAPIARAMAIRQEIAPAMVQELFK